MMYHRVERLSPGRPDCSCMKESDLMNLIDVCLTERFVAVSANHGGGA